MAEKLGRKIQLHLEHTDPDEIVQSTGFLLQY